MPDSASSKQLVVFLSDQFQLIQLTERSENDHGKMMKDVNSETLVKNSGPQDQIVLKRQRMVCFRDESVH